MRFYLFFVLLSCDITVIRCDNTNVMSKMSCDVTVVQLFCDAPFVTLQAARCIARNISATILTY